MLYCYENFTPNNDNSVYYLSGNFYNYLSFIDNNYLYTQIDTDNYRIDNNIVRLPASITNLHNITYFYEDITHRFYIVKNYTPFPNYVEFEVETDLWATFIYEANFNKIRLLRSNRNIGDIGIYDDIKYTVDSESIIPISEVDDLIVDSDGTISEDDAYAVIVASFTRPIGMFGIYFDNDKLSFTTVLATSLKNFRIYAKEYTSTSVLDNVNAVDIALDIVGGIYNAQLYQTTDNVTCMVNSMYIVPYNFIEINEDVPSITGISKGFYSQGNDIFVRMQHIKNDTKLIDVNIDNEIIDANKRYYVGTKNSGLNVKHFYGKNNVYYKCVPQANGLKIDVGQGDIHKDITSAFECTMTVNNATETSLQKTSKFIGVASSVLTTVFSTATALATKNPSSLAIAGGLVASGLSTASQILPNENIMREINSGDGASTYYTSISQRIASPFVITSFYSWTNEEDNAKIYGLNYDIYIASLNTLQQYSLIHGASNDYIKAECEVSNIPTDIASYIYNKLANGIFVKFII